MNWKLKLVIIMSSVAPQMYAAHMDLLFPDLFMPCVVAPIELISPAEVQTELANTQIAHAALLALIDNENESLISLPSTSKLSQAQSKQQIGQNIEQKLVVQSEQPAAKRQKVKQQKDRPFACLEAECDKSFKKKHHLKEHARTHTGEKPHKCTRCRRAFAQHSTLYQHINGMHLKLKRKR